MVIVSSLISGISIYKLFSTDKMYAFIPVLLFLLPWLFYLIVTFIRLYKNQKDVKLKVRFNRLSLIFTILPFFATFGMLKAIIVNKDYDLPLGYALIILIADFLFFLNIKDGGI